MTTYDALLIALRTDNTSERARIIRQTPVYVLMEVIARGKREGTMRVNVERGFELEAVQLNRSTEDKE